MARPIKLPVRTGEVPEKLVGDEERRLTGSVSWPPGMRDEAAFSSAARKWLAERDSVVGGDQHGIGEVPSSLGASSWPYASKNPGVEAVQQHAGMPSPAVDWMTSYPDDMAGADQYGEKFDKFVQSVRDSAADSREFERPSDMPLQPTSPSSFIPEQLSDMTNSDDLKALIGVIATAMAAGKAGKAYMNMPKTSPVQVTAARAFSRAAPNDVTRTMIRPVVPEASGIARLRNDLADGMKVPPVK